MYMNEKLRKLDLIMGSTLLVLAMFAMAHIGLNMGHDKMTIEIQSVKLKNDVWLVETDKGTFANRISLTKFKFYTDAMNSNLFIGETYDCNITKSQSLVLYDYRNIERCIYRFPRTVFISQL